MRTPAARAKTPENCVTKTVWVHIRKRVDVVLVRVGPRTARRQGSSSRRAGPPPRGAACHGGTEGRRRSTPDTPGPPPVRYRARVSTFGVRLELASSRVPPRARPRAQGGARAGAAAGRGPRPGSRAAPVRALKLLSHIFDFVLSEHINMRLRLVTADEPEAARAAS